MLDEFNKVELAVAKLLNNVTVEHSGKIEVAQILGISQKIEVRKGER